MFLNHSQQNVKWGKNKNPGSDRDFILFFILKDKLRSLCLHPSSASLCLPGNNQLT